MTDRELAGCAALNRYMALQLYVAAARQRGDDEAEELLCDEADALWKSGVEMDESIWTDACLWLARCVENWPQSRTPSSEGDGRDGERYRRWRLLAASGTMSESVCEMMIAARTEDDIDAAIDAASQQEGK